MTRTADVFDCVFLHFFVLQPCLSFLQAATFSVSGTVFIMCLALQSCATLTIHGMPGHIYPMTIWGCTATDSTKMCWMLVPSFFWSALLDQTKRFLKRNPSCANSVHHIFGFWCELNYLHKLQQTQGTHRQLYFDDVSYAALWKVFLPSQRWAVTTVSCWVWGMWGCLNLNPRHQTKDILLGSSIECLSALFNAWRP